MRFASLGSGSRGNALVVEAGRTRVLLDCGFSLRETEIRLARLGIEARDLAAILVTHE
ncbi:MAG TPA: MBL fold metallo-hydrolase, partial [Burkholderiales bacterium]